MFHGEYEFGVNDGTFASPSIQPDHMKSHLLTSFIGLPGLSSLPLPGMRGSGGSKFGLPVPGQTSVGSNGFNEHPDAPAAGITPDREILRIDAKIFMYNCVLVGSAAAIGITCLLFVKSVLDPSSGKGFGGGESDTVSESGDYSESGNS